MIKTEPVKFVQEPSDVSVRIGDRLSVPCQATGHPDPVVTWSAMDGRKVTVVDGSLQFDHVDASVRGRYRCEAANGAGDPVSKVIEVRVNGIWGCVSLFFFILLYSFL